jgi:hypothetical protein
MKCPLCDSSMSRGYFVDEYKYSCTNFNCAGRRSMYLSLIRAIRKRIKAAEVSAREALVAHRKEG